MDSTTILSENQILTLIIIEATINAFSLLASLFIVSVYLRFKNLRSLAFFLITMMSFADLIRAFTGIMSLFRIQEAYQNNQTDKGIICQSQAFLLNWSGLSVVIWADIIFWMLYSATIRKKEFPDENRWKYAVFGFGIPFVASLVPLILGRYGPVGQKCWIALLDNNGSLDLLTNLILTLSEYYIPLWLSMLFLSFGTVVLIKYVRANLGGHQDRFVDRLRWYPVTLIACWTFPTINRVYSAITGEQLYWLQIMHVSSAGFQGLLNALVYGYTDSVRHELHKSCCPCIPLRRVADSRLEDTNSFDNFTGLSARLSIDVTPKIEEPNKSKPNDCDSKVSLELQAGFISPNLDTNDSIIQG